MINKTPIMNREVCQFIQAKADGKGEGELWVYGDITDDKWYDSDVTPAGVRDALKDMGTISTLNIRVNSYGGSVFAGNAIINIISSYKKKSSVKVHAYIEGIAASMGSNIPMVADYIYAADNALYMLHKPSTFAWGNANDLNKAVETLDKAEETLINNYMRHFTGTEDELRQLLADETWLTAEEALAYGLCDEVVESVKVAASAKSIKYGTVDFAKENIPADFIKQTNGDDKGKEDKRDMSRFKYDSALMDRFGIDEAAFAEFGVSSESVVAILSAAKIEKPKAEAEEAEESDDAEKDGEGEEETEPKGDAEPKGEEEPAKEPDGEESGENVSITEDRVKTALGEAMNAEKILALAAKGMKYDALCKDAADEAIKQGVRAMGAAFDEELWRKTLDVGQFDLTDIQKFAQTWGGEAASALNAGKRMSVPASSEETNGKRKPTVAPKDRL
jgi:ATP-dependent Clp protease, protease subunit